MYVYIMSMWIYSLVYPLCWIPSTSSLPGKSLLTSRAVEIWLQKEKFAFFFLKHFVPLLGYSSHCTVIYRFIQLSHSLKAHRRYSVKMWWMNKCMKCGRQKLHFNHFSITMNLLRGKQTMAFGPNLVCGLFCFCFCFLIKTLIF